MTEAITQPVDEERSQSRARITISVISLVAFAVILYRRGMDLDITLGRCLATILAYLAFSVAWYVWVRLTPYQHHWRRYVTMVADLGIMTAFMHFGDRHVASYYPIFLWVIIGNGIRFGKRILLFAVAVATLGFGSLLLYSDFWQEHLAIGLGLLAGVIVLPVFFLTVLERLKNMSRLELELARSKLADKAKDQFLATMSHEIRTPMNGILGMAETLRESDLQPEQQSHLNIITRSVESLLNIINDILDYSKITSDSLTLESEPFDLREVLQDVFLLMKSTAESKGVEMTFDYPEPGQRYFRGDTTRVRQIALNLVGNAIKFTESGRIDLVCRLTDTGTAHQVELVIRDTGIGIQPERLEAIFDQFEQADNSTTRQYGGTGLGLSISRKLAVKMGGGIVAESRPGAGSKFTVTLRLSACAEPERKLRNERRELPDFGLKALLAEDNKFNQVVVVNLLKRVGIAVDIAENGAEALQMLEEAPYDLVFMDVRMPVMNGYIAAETIRRRGDALARIPILALTAEATKNDVKKCLEAGMNVHLSKPVRLAEVVEAVENLDLKPVAVP